ncbi:hypothetical protein J6590_061969 [Homalodisca vitripennis]|nr:hypothetical protein J6590_061969 [Homalodisca vitripennis]
MTKGQSVHLSVSLPNCDNSCYIDPRDLAVCLPVCSVSLAKGLSEQDRDSEGSPSLACSEDLAWEEEGLVRL